MAQVDLWHGKLRLLTNWQRLETLNGIESPVTLYDIHSTDRHVLAIMQADLCRAHPYNQKVMSLYLLKA
jgi:hypothetical protein